MPFLSQISPLLQAHDEMLAKEIKTGMVVSYNAAPVLINAVTVQTPSARGAATLYKFRGRDLINKQKVDITLKGTESLDEADFERRPVKLMYVDSESMHVLDQTDYNQYSIPLADAEEERLYITEELEGVLALIYNNECVGLQLPTTVELLVVECDPSVKGDSATKRTKPARLETGLIVQVPEYLSQGERIKVDSRTGQFISRV
jgi:elongation factor P